jgi:enoyl-CoA hydratase/carnithine racemase
VSTQRERDTLVLTVDSGENRLTLPVLDEWEQALATVEQDETITSFVSIGAGKFYSNGLDLDTLSGPDGGDKYLDRVNELLARLITLPVVTVSGIVGHAFGAGAMLALAHDQAVMRRDRGFICLPEVDLGMPFPPLMGALLRATLDVAVAREAMTLGMRFGGKEAKERRMVAMIVQQTEVLPAALWMASDRGGKNRQALQTIKEDVFKDVLAHRPSAR